MLISSNITPEIKSRISDDLYFVRGFAILLVVVGHVIGARSAGIRQLYEQELPILPWIYNFIYTFHMPIFFIAAGISFGFFSKPDTSYIKFAKSRFLRLIIPLLFWFPIYFILRASSGKVNFSILGIFNEMFLTNFIFWFIPTLTFASFLSFVVLKTINSQIIYIIISIILFIFRFYYPNGLLSLWFYFNIFYAFGCITANYLAHFEQNIRKKSAITIIFLMLLLLITMLFINNLSVNQLLVKLINGILGFFLLYILASYNWSKALKLPSQPFTLLKNTFIYWGKISMSIYLIHVIFGSFTRTLLVKIGITEIIAQFAIGLFVSLVGSVLIYNFFSTRSKLFLYSIGEAKS